MTPESFFLSKEKLCRTKLELTAILETVKTFTLLKILLQLHALPYGSLYNSSFGSPLSTHLLSPDLRLRKL